MAVDKICRSVDLSYVDLSTTFSRSVPLEGSGAFLRPQFKFVTIGASSPSRVLRSVAIFSSIPCTYFTYCCPVPKVNEYLAETEAAMTKPETGEFLFDDLRELAASHAKQKLEFEQLIPENISLGLFVVGGRVA